MEPVQSTGASTPVPGRLGHPEPTRSRPQAGVMQVTPRHHVVRYSGTGGRGVHSLRGTSSVDRGSAGYGEEGPQTGNPLQFVLATLAEVDPGANDEVLDHSRYEDLTRCGECPDAGRDMDC